MAEKYFGTTHWTSLSQTFPWKTCWDKFYVKSKNKNLMSNRINFSRLLFISKFIILFFHQFPSFFTLIYFPFFISIWFMTINFILDVNSSIKSRSYIRPVILIYSSKNPKFKYSGHESSFFSILNFHWKIYVFQSNPIFPFLLIVKSELKLKMGVW